MLNLKTTVSVQQERNVNIESHVFYKQGHYFRAVIEESFITIFHIEGMRTWMSHDSVESSKREIIEAYDSWEHISEEEFFEALGKALKDFDFEPKISLRSFDTEQEENRRAEIKNY